MKRAALGLRMHSGWGVLVSRFGRRELGGDTRPETHRRHESNDARCVTSPITTRRT